MTCAEPTRTGPDHGDRGFAVVWAAGAIAALLVLASVVCWLGTALVTRHRAAGAADLAALGAAGHAVHGQEEACARARTVADRMGARVRECELLGWDAVVRVEASPPDALAGLGATTARARAGPP
ncbi:Rv3654c family TadE-like protein [Amycolatopsis aidingensis]|uniref:Rv3654c family TadE-like protein n=1 Tax=Amycolatopsis aidingensis TaxID=2842453 RepID=UPI001C0E4F10|nr:Rv3654c family TadE-like protein [Amycolatopsis aidingensis]